MNKKAADMWIYILFAIVILIMAVIFIYANSKSSGTTQKVLDSCSLLNEKATCKTECIAGTHKGAPCMVTKKDPADTTAEACDKGKVCYCCVPD